MKDKIRLLHGSLTILTKVEAGAEEALRAELKRVNQFSDSFFAGWPDVYFARWAMLHQKKSTYLLFAVDFARADSKGARLSKDALDREFITRFIEVLIARGDRTFDTLYAHCVGYPPRGIEKREGEAVLEFLMGHHFPYTGRHIDFAYRVASPGELVLAERVRTEVDGVRHRNEAKLPTRREVKPEEACQDGARFHAHCREKLSFASCDVEQRRQKLKAAELAAAWATVTYGLGIGLLGGAGVAMVGGLALLGFRNPGRMVAVYSSLAGAGGVWGLSSWLRSWLRAPTPVRPVRDPPGWVEKPVQNPMVHVVDIKRGREWLVKLALKVVNLRAKRYRAGLNVLRTIHLARWVITRTEEGCQLVFLSNYDGSWDAYIGDFVDLLSRFLNAAWFNTLGYPKTWLWFLRGGAEDIEAFRCWIREHEVGTELWYQHGVKTLSINNIHNDLQLCGLLSEEKLSKEDYGRLVVLLRTGLCLTQERMRTPFSALKFIQQHHKGLPQEESRTWTSRS